MTQEEKAKSYDRALEIAKAWCKLDNNNLSNDDLETLFPELKESEDEKTKKCLLKYFENRGANGVIWNKIGISRENVLAWIEKQGEQKPVDNVEPKFKVGDWVVFNNKHQSIYKVEKIEDGYYILRHTHGGSFRVCVLHDESLRPWTIADAKDGDVLVASDASIFLFGGVYGGACKYYAALTADNYVKINKEAKGGYWETSRAVYPATKEQRDLLFTKMKEAGYEWHKDKKELKLLISNGGDFEPCDENTKWGEDENIIREIKLPMIWIDNENPRERRWLSWLEKQDSHKVWTDNDYDKIKSIEYLLHELDNHNFDDWFNYILNNDECKPIVVKKFSEGDWIINNDVYGDVPVKIKEIGNYLYLCERQDGVIIELNKDAVLKEFKHWDISDAKDGDILSWDDSKCIALFKNIYDEDSFNSHGFVGHCTGAFESRVSYHDIKGAHPATKEQCDLLFIKMHDAGYEWDCWKKRCIKK